jgi:hypothetical protein
MGGCGSRSEPRRATIGSRLLPLEARTGRHNAPPNNLAIRAALLYQNIRGQTTAEPFSMSIPEIPNAADTRVFQFRISTLFILTTWSAFCLAGLTWPTRIAAVIISSGTLFVLLSSALVAIYRRGRTRAAAIGFIVFWIGSWAYAVAWFGDDSVVRDWFHFYHRYSGLNSGLSWLDEQNFLIVFHQILATLLGLLGSLLAQYLYATQPREKPTNITQ